MSALFKVTVDPDPLACLHMTDSSDSPLVGHMAASMAVSLVPHIFFQVEGQWDFSKHGHISKKSPVCNLEQASRTLE